MRAQKTRAQFAARCRICGAATSPRNASYPFCSEQCRERDLGNWASGVYRVASSAPDEDDFPDEAAQHSGSRSSEE